MKVFSSRDSSLNTVCSIFFLPPPRRQQYKICFSSLKLITMREVLDQEPKKKKKKRDRKIRVDVRNISGGDALHMICFRHLRPCISSGLRIHHEMGQREREGERDYRWLKIITFSPDLSHYFYTRLCTREQLYFKKKMFYFITQCF